MTGIKIQATFRLLLCSFVTFLNISANQAKAIEQNKTIQTPIANGPSKPIGLMNKLYAEKTTNSKNIVASNQSKNLTNPALLNTGDLFKSAPKWLGIPKAFVNLGNIGTSYALVVEKLHHRMMLFKANPERTYEVIKTYRAITGKDPGDKTTTGDLRTPEGIYFITGKLADKQLPAKYGGLAFTLDYPNIFDQRQRKSGYGIWIHSTDDPKRLLNPFDTEGCVVVSNDDIVDIAKYITPFETPIVITKEMATSAESETKYSREKALEMIEGWRQAWETSNFDSYMGHYSKKFISLGKSKNAWLKYKKNLSEVRKKDIEILISEPKILAFEDQLLAVFMQEYNSKLHTDFGRKFLYLKWEGDRYRIIAEKWYKAKRSSETALKNIKHM